METFEEKKLHFREVFTPNKACHVKQKQIQLQISTQIGLFQKCYERVDQRSTLKDFPA